MNAPAARKTYKDTLNLPRTSFAMKANLVQNEPASLKRWQAMELYQRLRDARRGSPRYVFHDGPPYANGSIHLGHLLNKVLKDLVVRSRSMLGQDCPFIPGWDCHGLPIEHRVMQDLGPRARELAPLQIRQRCQQSAEKFIRLQKTQMQRLLTLADYDNPYITMAPAYEARVLEVFADLVARGLVYRALKPVHWSIENRTALAEAELEYYERQDTSVYVLFEVANPDALPAAGGWASSSSATPVHLMIWTTTPWTLPANLAVAAHGRYEYGLYRFNHRGKPALAILARQLAPKVLAQVTSDFQELANFPGSQLTSLQYRHPFIDRVSPVVTAEYVTLEDGTGLVHTAPGHGVEDYLTGLKHNLPIYCPVQDDGAFDATAPDFLRGRLVWDANALVVEHLRQSGHLFFDHNFTHSYPHDWRGKTPTIFRATEQWFISVDREGQGESAGSLRAAALKATGEGVEFVPAWGQNRMRGMLESRPDWCISRQRAWGLPIPAFFNDQGQPLLTAASVRAVAKVVAQHGSDAWFKLDAAPLLEYYDAAADPDRPAWISESKPRFSAALLRKGADIFDVWFDSGSSWNAALRRMQGDFPADLYLEGSDQHRGWFQVSLLCALGSQGQPPFRTLLTHGFTVDKDGRKMSKSLGNTIEVEELLKELGADVCRWWVCSLNTEGDIKVDLSFLRLAGEEYRKVRNTLRFLLSNLGDFSMSAHAHAWAREDAASLDAWVLGELDKLIVKVRACYESFDFLHLSRALYDFCNDTLSAVYLTAGKDRLYCDKPDSPRRRRTQTAIWHLADALVRLLAPILPHTADEAWRALHGEGDETREGQGPGARGPADDGTAADDALAQASSLKPQASVHLALFPSPRDLPVADAWAAVLDRRDSMLKAIEDARAQRSIDNPLDIGLVWPADKGFDQIAPVDLADLCGISRFALAGADASPRVDDLRDQPRCERSWKRDGTVKERSDGGMLCDRCADAMGLA